MEDNYHLIDYNYKYENAKFWNFSQLSTNCEKQNTPNTLFAIFILFIVVVGLVGNLLVCFSLVVLKEYKKTVTNWYYLHLTVADSLFLLMLPFSAISELSGKWDFSLYLCKFKEAILFINYYASIYFLVVMSFDRYLAVTKVFSSTKWRSKLRSPLACHILSAMGWIISVLLCIPLFQHSLIDSCKICAYSFPLDKTGNENENSYFAEYIDMLFPNNYQDWSDADDDQFSSLFVNQLENNTSGFQGLDENHEDKCRLPESNRLYIWIYGSFLGAFVLPLILICFFYGTILRRLCQASHVEKSSRQRLNKRRVTMAVLALISVFVVSWLPWYVEKLAKVRGLPLSPANCSKLKTSLRGLAYLNSAMNPYIYSFWRTDFRARMSKISSKFRIWLPCTLKKTVFDATTVKTKQCNCISGSHLGRNKKRKTCQSRRSSAATNRTEKTMV